MSEQGKTISARRIEANRDRLPWGAPLPFLNSIPAYRGEFRGERSTLSAKTDAEAVSQWLAETASDSPSTARAYRREAERLMLWAGTVLGKCISDLQRDDFLRYKEFLKDPGQDWVMSSKLPRHSGGWRPFVAKGMNDRSVYYALTIVGGLMKFLFSCGYLWVNPVPNFKAPPRATFSPRSRSISTGHKRYVLEAVALDLNETPAKKLTQARNRWIVQVLLHSAMRINELATHTFDDFRAIETAKGTVQTLAVSGKGGKQRLIPIPHELVVERERFLAAWRKAGWPGSVNNLPLAPTVKNVGKDGWIYSELYAPLSTRQIDRLLKTVMDDAGERAIMNSDPHAAQTLQKVSAHWLRHTRLRELADSTSDLRVVQAVAGHSDINTSAGYSAKGLEDLAEAMGLDDT